MATVFASPSHLPEPPTFVMTDGRYDHAATEAAEAEWLDALRTYCQEYGKGDLKGKMIYLPHADGAAQYMILDARRLIHVPLGDAWHVPDYQTRGLRAADLRRMAV